MIAETDEMRQAVYEALCAVFRLGPGSLEADALIQPGYAEPENAPRPPRERNVIYYWLEKDEEAESRDQEIVLENGETEYEGRAEIRNFLAYRLVIVCYGPKSEENARRIRALLFMDGYRKPRRILRVNGIYLVPNPGQPEILREPAGSLWRRRADLVVRLRVKDEVRSGIDLVKVGPEIRIVKG